MALYKVRHSHGVTERAVDTYDNAVAIVRSVYGDDVEIGHSGDIQDFGERTLCWKQSVPEDDRCGSTACCVIRRIHDDSEVP